jgi:hypothetical protein
MIQEHVPSGRSCGIGIVAGFETAQDWYVSILMITMADHDDDDDDDYDNGG